MFRQTAAVAEYDRRNAKSHRLDRRIAKGFLRAARKYEQIKQLKVVTHVLLKTRKSHDISYAARLGKSFEICPLGPVADDQALHRQNPDLRNCSDQSVDPLPAAKICAGSNSNYARVG